MKPEIWGLTGGVASGKTTAAAFFKELGLEVIDADQLARELSAPNGNAHPLILRRFGTCDRAKLRELVFRDPKARHDLEAILHPLIQAECLARIEKLTASGLKGPFIYEAALLIETGRYHDLQGLIVVEAPRQNRVDRLLSRDGITRELAEKMIDSQVTDEMRRAAATEILENLGTAEELREKTRELVARRGW